MQPSDRLVSVMAALALLSPTALHGCDARRGATGAPTPERDADPRTSLATTDRLLRARDAAANPIATGRDGCPLSRVGLNGRACSLPESTECVVGHGTCRCEQSVWRCEQVRGPLPPPDLTS
jgi:hypothetical protein